MDKSNHQLPPLQSILYKGYVKIDFLYLPITKAKKHLQSLIANAL